MRQWLSALAGLLLAGVVHAQQGPPQPPADSPSTKSAEHVFVPAEAIEWQPAPSALPPGAQAVVLRGDPAAEGMFTMRLRLPAGFRVAPHFHAADEHVTVLSGTVKMGLGKTFDERSGTTLSPGSFAVMPAGTIHYAWALEGAVLQVHAMGPWKLTYVNPADDPRTSSGR